MGYLSEEAYQRKLDKIQKKNASKERKLNLKAEKHKYNSFHSFITKTKTSNKILFISIAAVIWFTLTSIHFQRETYTELSSTLTTLWFSFWTSEIVVLAGIKVSKVIKNHSTHTENVNDLPINESDGVVG